MGEWRVCLIKAGFVREAAGGHDLIETMRFEPDTGVARLERHLERMKASAAELGFAFDRHETRNRVQALCFELEGPTRLRLLLARSGEISLETSALPPPREGDSLCIPLPLPVVPATGGCATRAPTAAFTTSPAPWPRRAARTRRCSCARTGW
jgi:para-aminobenzoate synthetase/4-amino-4-deoxychorismate lyase